MEEKNSITNDMYYQLVKKLEQKEHELELFKQKAPIVGVRWYGEGGFGIGLTYPIQGITKVILDRYGAVAVIDKSSWLRIKNTEEVKNGVIVRDDRVIQEMGISGITAEPDTNVNNNAFTDDRVIEFLKLPISKFKHVVMSFTHHFPARHFLKVAKQNGFSEQEKLYLLRSRYGELFIRFNYSLLNIHDLRSACELRKIDFEGLTAEELINILVAFDVKRDTEIDYGE